MKVLFIHENTLGHGSYLPPFANYFQERPELGIEPELLNATPLPPELAREADHTVRGLRRFGLDNHFARWRTIVSKHVRSEVERRLDHFDAIVVNTQSIGLDLAELKKPLFVALDATFTQLSRGRWFSNPPLGRVAAKLISKLIAREKELFDAATRVLPWSRKAADSLEGDYGIRKDKITILPPSLKIPAERNRTKNAVPRALFIGGDFKRKGGDILLKCFEQYFVGGLELDLVTQSDVERKPGVRVWQKVTANSPEWKALWENADLFVFPSRLETFGIVLVEALAFGVPVIASKAGAAEEILADGRAGVLLKNNSVKELREAIENVLANESAARERTAFGRERALTEYNLVTNSEKLAGLLR